MSTRRDFMIGGSAAILAGAAPRVAWAATQADVIVIGAGLAGLFAAHRLENAGLKAIIVEAEPRVGGRLHTLDDLPGHPDAGGIQVGSGYRRLRDIADDLKVPLIPGGDEIRATPLYRIGETTLTADRWPSSPANRLSDAERAIAPAALGGFYGAKLAKLAKPEDWMKADTIRALDMPWSAKLAELGASAEARRLIAANLNGNSLETLSALHVARSAAIFRAGPGPTFTIGGGSQRIPEAMAKALGSPIRLSTPVRAIREEQDGVTITLANGERLHARHAICTIPFSAMGRIKLDKPDPVLRRALKGLAYTRGTFIYIRASEPFWKSDGFPETLWTDDPLLGRVFVLGSDPPMLKIFATGAVSAALDRLAPKRAMTETVRRIETARPAARGKLTPLKLWSWQKQPHAGGIYHHLSPGMAPTMATLAQREGGRLHFAGEHLAISNSGMEGALESGDRVGRAVAART